jgi:tetratricopeptide (TPR) repeat protein/tRNA A-37 threonylcarbamoyl transferase component Bud32
MNEESLFHEALALPAGERAAFLERTCAGNPELRAAVEALLAAHEGPGGLLDRPAIPRPTNTVDFAPAEAGPGEEARTVPPRDADDAGQPEPGASRGPTGTVDFDPSEAGSVVEDKTVPPADAGDAPPSKPSTGAAGAVIASRYTLVEKIGEGGMGEVWVAQQTEPVKRRVALKLIKAGMDSGAVLARFNLERQALAVMDHPNIAKVLDGGMTATGQPFFVMELVDGQPLNRFCDGGKLTPKERLELFVPICQAVQHAHQKGIVHRDLKPANILVGLVDGKPVPKVIDFGVAKAVGEKLTDEAMATQIGAVIGTLEYMAPEQAGGEDIDTRADIYSLGVILYELLTGLRPIDASRFRKAALLEMIMVLIEEEPSKPSTRLSTADALPSLAAARQTEPKRLMAMLRGELDWVVMKCLEKQRDRRYETANGLARDIQRYLSDEPVEARPPSAGYRFRKFVHRNKGQVIAASLVLLALVGGVVGTSIGMFEAKRQERVAEGRRQEAEDQRNQAVIARTAAETSSRVAQEQRRVALDAVGQLVTTVRTELMKKPDLQGVLKAVLAIAQSSLDKIAQNPLVDISLNDTTRAALHDATAQLHQELGNTPAALADFNKAVDIYQAILDKAADGPDKEVVKKNLIIVLLSLGHCTMRTESQAAAQAYYERAAQLVRRVDDKTSNDSRKTLIEYLIHVGIVTGNRRPREARENYVNALRVAEEIARQETEARGKPSVDTRLTLWRTHFFIGGIEKRLRELTASDQHIATARTLAAALVAEEPGNHGRMRLLALTHERIGDLRLRTNKPQDAAGEFATAAGLFKTIADANRKNVNAQADLARTLYSQGLAADRSGDPAAAARHFRAAVDIQKSRVNLATDMDAKRDLMMSLAHVGNHAEAAEMAETVRVKLPKDPGALLDIACCYAVCAAAVPAAGAEKEVHEHYASKALEALKQAIDNGYGDKVNVETEPDLDPIRNRPEFKDLSARLPEP